MVRLVTMNVGGLCDDLAPAAARMDEIHTKLLTDVEPDVLCFQEVIDDMYEVLRSRTRATWGHAGVVSASAKQHGDG